MNKLYEGIAKAIRMNTLTLRSRSTGDENAAVDKNGLVEALSDYFAPKDVLFIPDDFAKACEEVKETK